MLAFATLELRMTHISGFERDQLVLLPEAVDDYVGLDNPVRFIDAFVDGLDVAAAGFLRVAAKAMGRPGYAPGDLLKLYIYGYLNRVRSSRRVERECHRNIEVIWLLRTLKPDFKTIADFRRDNARRFAPCSASSYCCAGASTCTGASCWPSTEPASRRSTTGIATSPALRCDGSSAAPTSGWKTTSSGSTRATSRMARQGAARARRTWPKRCDVGGDAALAGARVLRSVAGSASGSRIRRVPGGSVQAVSRAADGRAVPAAGTVFPHAHDRLFRGHRQRAGPRVA